MEWWVVGVLAAVIVAGAGISAAFFSYDTSPPVVCGPADFMECAKKAGCFWYEEYTGERFCASARPQELCGLHVQGLDNCTTTWKGYEYDTNANTCREKAVQGCEYRTPFSSLDRCRQTCIVTVPAVCEQIAYFSLCKIADSCYWDLEADKCITVDAAFLCSAKMDGEGLCRGHWTGYEYDPDTNDCKQAGASGCSITAPFYTIEKCQETCVR